MTGHCHKAENEHPSKLLTDFQSIATKMIHKQSEMELTQVRMPDDLTGSVFLSQRVDKMTSEHMCQSLHNHPGLVLKSLHAPSAGNCSLRARLTIMV